MSTLVIDHRDVALDYELECLLIRQKHHPVRSIPLHQLQRILCMHNTQISTRLIGHCQKAGIDFIVLNSRYSEYSFAVHANHQLQAGRRLQQYQLTVDRPQSFELARRLVRHKLAVSCRLLARQPTSAGSTHAQKIQRQIYHTLRINCDDMATLRGLEGYAQRALYQYWQSCIPSALGFRQRQRRPPPDPVNALLSLTFTLVYHEAIRQSLRHGLDPWLGFYHQPAAGRRSLACDLMEPLRPLVEYWVMRCFADGELDRRHFALQHGQSMLGKEGRSHYYQLWYQSLPDWSRKLGKYARLLARYCDARAAA